MLKFLLVLLCIFFLLRLLGKMFVVSTFNNLNKRMHDEFNRRQGNSGSHRQEGQVTIDPGVPNKKSNDSGDYVDYEEVK